MSMPSLLLITYITQKWQKETVGSCSPSSKRSKVLINTSSSPLSQGSVGFQESLFSQGPIIWKTSVWTTRYAAMMGYTQEEIRQYFGQYVQAITHKRNAQGQSTSEEEILAEIKDWYNGYRFSEEAVYVYNPFSTVRACTWYIQPRLCQVSTTYGWLAKYNLFKISRAHL